MSHASRSTTNNQAEYQGLIVGLGAATSLKLKRFEVVGDSALIIRQLQDYRPHRNKILRNHYTRARRLADQLCIHRWTHHVRAHNKMADLLANLVMDSRSSSQVLHPTTREVTLTSR